MVQNQKRRRLWKSRAITSSRNDSLRDRLESRLGTHFTETSRAILVRFEDLYQKELDLVQQKEQKAVLETFQVQVLAVIQNIERAIANPAPIKYDELIFQVVGLLQEGTNNVYQLTTEQNIRLQILEKQLGMPDSLANDNQSLANQHFAEVLNQTTFLQAQIQEGSSSSSSY